MLPVVTIQMEYVNYSLQIFILIWNMDGNVLNAYSYWKTVSHDKTMISS